MTSKVWVTMTDKFMSGWGMAQDKINKFIVECDTWEQAQLIKRNAQKRPEMKYINIVTTKPRYNSKRYLESWKEFKEMSGMWIA